MRYAEISRLEDMDYSGTEALNSICSNIAFIGRDKKKFVLTSCTENEGKSSMAFQIMANMAKRGRTVCLIDGDLRKSMMIKRFGIKIEGEACGLVHYLAGYNNLDDVVYETNIPGAYIIPAGRDVANPLTLLDSEYYQNMMDMLGAKFDLVIVDAPPVGMVIDSAILSKACDGAIMVVEYGSRHKGELLDSVRQIQQSGCPVIGCIINKVRIKSLSEKSYYKSHYYAYSHYSHYEYKKGEKE